MLQKSFISLVLTQKSSTHIELILKLMYLNLCRFITLFLVVHPATQIHLFQHEIISLQKLFPTNTETGCFILFCISTQLKTGLQVIATLRENQFIIKKSTQSEFVNQFQPINTISCEQLQLFVKTMIQDVATNIHGTDILYLMIKDLI